MRHSAPAIGFCPRNDVHGLLQGKYLLFYIPAVLTDCEATKFGASKIGLSSENKIISRKFLNNSKCGAKKHSQLVWRGGGDVQKKCELGRNLQISEGVLSVICANIVLHSNLPRRSLPKQMSARLQLLKCGGKETPWAKKTLYSTYILAYRKHISFTNKMQCVPLCDAYGVSWQTKFRIANWALDRVFRLRISI